MLLLLRVGFFFSLYKANYVYFSLVSGDGNGTDRIYKRLINIRQFLFVSTVINIIKMTTQSEERNYMKVQETALLMP